MPELPEVESFARGLHASYAGKRIRSFTLQRADLRFPFNQKALASIFAPGRTIQSVVRIGKQLEWRTCHPDPVHVSLGMSGAFLATVLGSPQKHEHVTIAFASGDALGFVDPRRFGFWQCPGDPHFGKVGCGADPLDPQALAACLDALRKSGSQRSIKDVLMDQSRIEGIGNIYALEALFLCGLHPALPINKIARADLERLATCIPPILEGAIAAGGSTVKTYRTLNGAAGHAQDLHRVYDREGESCLRSGCAGLVLRMAQGGRSSWYCAVCQPLRRPRGVGLTSQREFARP